MPVKKRQFMFRPSKIAACTESTKGNKIIDSNDLEYTQIKTTRKKRRSSIRRKTVKNIVGNITGYVLRATSNLFSKPVKIHMDDHSSNINSKPSSDSSINLDEIVFTTVDKKKGGKSRRKNKRTHGTKKNVR